MTETAYANIDDVLAFFSTEPKGAKRARLESLLTVATDEMIGELGGLDFFRHPTTGSRTWYVDMDGSSIVHLHRGVISLDTLAISLDLGATFDTIEETEYRLTSGYSDTADPLTGEPYFHLELLPYGTWRHFPRGKGLVRLTGATGWPAIPSPAREGVAERARQIAFADPAYQGMIPAEEDYGQPVVMARWPEVTWRFLQREKQRFMACDL